jgi:1-acyl-sn-glycerol-3-phosphate acyltransferase
MEWENMIILYISGGFLALIVLYVLFLGICALSVSPDKIYEKNSPFFRFLLESATAVAIKLLRIRVHISGAEKIPENEKVLFVCNHRSNFDPLITWCALKKWKLAFVSKPENFKIPIAKQIITRCRFMAIDRENPRNSMKTLLKAIDYIKNDRGSIGIYPEGTRSKNCKLLPVHDGIFKVAQKANVPIVVGTLVGTDQIKKHFPFRRTIVHFDIVDVITPEKGQTSHELAEQVRTLMSDKIYEYEQGRYELNEDSSENFTTSGETHEEE